MVVVDSSTRSWRRVWVWCVGGCGGCGRRYFKGGGGYTVGGSIVPLRRRNAVREGVKGEKMEMRFRLETRETEGDEELARR